MAAVRKPWWARLRHVSLLAMCNPHRLLLANTMKMRRGGWLRLRRNRIGPVRFPFDPAIGHYMRAMQTGEYEFATVACFLHYLRRGSIHIEVGGNIGYLAAWALRCVGPRGEVHVVEPAAALVARLEHLAGLNPRYRLVIHPVAAGDAAGTTMLNLAGDAMMGSSTLVSEAVADAEALGQEPVRVVRLDAHIDPSIAARAALVKIDVEGYEDHVLRGMEGWFRQGFTAPIVCELTPAAIRLAGRDPDQTITFMESWDYQACSLTDFQPIPRDRLWKLGKVFNVVFLRRELGDKS